MCVFDRMETCEQVQSSGGGTSLGAARFDEEPSVAAAGGLSPADAAPGPKAGAGFAAESQRRRSSVAVVSLQRRATASGRIGGRLSEQLRQTVMALGLSLLVAPLHLLSEVLMRLISMLPNVRPSPPCGRLLMDDTGTTCVAALVITVSFSSCSLGLVSRGPLRTAPHVLVGTAAHVLFLICYSSLGSVAITSHFLLCFSGIGLHIYVETVSLKLKGNWRRAPRALKESVAVATIGVIFAVACPFVRLLVPGLVDPPRRNQSHSRHRDRCCLVHCAVGSL